MTRAVHLHPEAAAEFEETVVWYEQRHPGLGRRLFLRPSTQRSRASSSGLSLRPRGRRLKRLGRLDGPPYVGFPTGSSTSCGRSRSRCWLSRTTNGSPATGETANSACDQHAKRYLTRKLAPSTDAAKAHSSAEFRALLGGTSCGVVARATVTQDVPSSVLRRGWWRDQFAGPRDGSPAEHDAIAAEPVPARYCRDEGAADPRRTAANGTRRPTSPADRRRTHHWTPARQRRHT